VLDIWLSERVKNELILFINWFNGKFIIRNKRFYYVIDVNRILNNYYLVSFFFKIIYYIHIYTCFYHHFNYFIISHCRCYNRLFLFNFNIFILQKPQCNAVLPHPSSILTSIPSYNNNSTILSCPCSDAKIDYFNLLLIFLILFYTNLCVMLFHHLYH
jgi:hypothetical protein